MYLEVGGSGGIASLNYENTFKQYERSSLTWSAGISGFYIDRNAGFFFVFPVALHYLYGPGKHKLEAGFGQGITLGVKGSFFLQSIPFLGYRYQPEDKKVFFRATYTPLVSYLIDLQYRHWFGLSIGLQL